MSINSKKEEQIVIVGAGIAGAAAAYFLSKTGFKHIVVLEKEKLAGVHATGRNAAFARAAINDRVNCRLAVAGKYFFQNPSPDFPMPINYNPMGLITLHGLDREEKIKAQVAMNQEHGLKRELISWAKACQLFPLLPGQDQEFVATLCPTDGDLDVNNLLQGFLKGARQKGAKVIFKAEVENIVKQNQRVTAVIAGGKQFPCQVLINAAGAWAGKLGQMAGAFAVPLNTCRRHLLMIKDDKQSTQGLPMVWNEASGVYLKPESGGFLLSPCDQEEIEPCDSPVDQKMVEGAVAKGINHFPALHTYSLVRAWSGIRTLTPDERFVVGPDPKVEGFYWLAGLGGHGVTVSPAIGSLLTAIILGREDKKLAVRLAPNRFAL